MSVLERAAAWARRTWRAALGELVATALLVALGLAPLVPRGPGSDAPLEFVAFAFAFAVVLLVQAFGGVSGAHMNPAVTLAALVWGGIGPAAAAAYLPAQLLGAALGYGALMALGDGRSFAVTHPGRNVSPAAACAVEALLTGSLALVACAVWAEHDARRPDRTVPLKFGLVIGGLVFSGGELTGASLNPARSLAPALLQSDWADQWVYWAGPLGGAALCAALMRWVLLPRRPAPAAPAPEELPLRDKPEC